MIMVTQNSFADETINKKIELIESFSNAAYDSDKVESLKEAAWVFASLRKKAEEYFLYWPEEAQEEWKQEFESYATLYGGQFDWENGHYNLPNMP